MNVAFRRVHQSGLLRRSVNEENITLKLTLILSSSLAFGVDRVLQVRRNGASGGNRTSEASIHRWLVCTMARRI